jgi:hypothetical protein
MGVSGSWPPSCGQHPSESPALLSSFPPFLYHPSLQSDAHFVQVQNIASPDENAESITFSPVPSLPGSPIHIPDAFADMSNALLQITNSTNGLDSPQSALSRARQVVSLNDFVSSFRLLLLSRQLNVQHVVTLYKLKALKYLS